MATARNIDEDQRSRTERSRADPTKAGGVHYTPPELAAFVATSALASAGERESLRILDPACGDGALLAAIVDTAPPSLRLDLVVGCDTDVEALAAADRRLEGSARPGLRWTLEACDFLADSASNRLSKESLFGEPSLVSLQQPFDVVIANPPYVRTQVLGAQEARRLAEAFDLSGRADLYHAFAVAMTEALTTGGTLALLCSNRFMTTKTGLALRQCMQSRLDVQAVYDLGDTKLFGAAVLPVVVVAKREPSGGSAQMASIYESPTTADPDDEASTVLGALQDGLTGHIRVAGRTYEIRRGTLRLDPRSTQPWVLAPDADDWVTQVDDTAAMRFGDVGKIRVGIKTTADSVFIRRDWNALGDDEPEAGVLLPLITHHVASKWSASQPVHRVLYPYDLTKSKRCALDLDTWPRTQRYLLQHRARLEGREYVVAGGRHWWEIWVPQRPSHWAMPKLVFRISAMSPGFFPDRTGAVVNGDCYWLSLVSERDEDLGLLMMAVANSSLGSRYYDRVCGNKLYSGRRRYITQYVERFPIPDPESPESSRSSS